MTVNINLSLDPTAKYKKYHEVIYRSSYYLNFLFKFDYHLV